MLNRRLRSSIQSIDIMGEALTANDGFSCLLTPALSSLFKTPYSSPPSSYLISESISIKHHHSRHTLMSLEGKFSLSSCRVYADFRRLGVLIICSYFSFSFGFNAIFLSFFCCRVCLTGSLKSSPSWSSLLPQWFTTAKHTTTWKSSSVLSKVGTHILCLTIHLKKKSFLVQVSALTPRLPSIHYRE